MPYGKYSGGGSRSSETAKKNDRIKKEHNAGRGKGRMPIKQSIGGKK